MVVMAARLNVGLDVGCGGHLQFISVSGSNANIVLGVKNCVCYRAAYISYTYYISSLEMIGASIFKYCSEKVCKMAVVAAILNLLLAL